MPKHRMLYDGLTKQDAIYLIEVDECDISWNDIYLTLTPMTSMMLCGLRNWHKMNEAQWPMPQSELDAQCWNTEDLVLDELLIEFDWK